MPGVSTSSPTRPPGLVLLVVLRGPCYLGLRSIVASGLQADGIVLLVEAGRSLTRRDVGDVCGVPVVAQIPVTANVARTIDAGLLVTRLPRTARTRRPPHLHRHRSSTSPNRATSLSNDTRHPDSRTVLPNDFPELATVSPQP